ncbi:MAG: hypothetical protein R6X20_09110 [Phycisphaerae bacterium]
MSRPWYTSWPLVAAAVWLMATAVPCPAAADGEAASPDAATDTPAETAPAEAADDETAAESAAEAAPDAPAETPEEPADEAGGPSKPPKGQKEMRLEDIRDLPPLRRYELPLEKGEQFLGDVEDNTFGYDESAFWWMVHLVHKMPAQAFDPGDATVGFAQLLAMPSAYRGKPVTVKGAYMTCAPFQTPVLAIRKDVPTLYECNIRELPLEEQRPVATVIVLEDPMEYLRVWDTVKVRGYFYKVRRYQGSKGEGLAPMLVARRLVPVEPTAGGTKPSSTVDISGGSVLLVFMIAAILALGVVYVFLRYKTKATPHAAHPGTSHRFNLRRPGRDEPAGRGGPGSEDGRPQP